MKKKQSKNFLRNISRTFIFIYGLTPGLTIGVLVSGIIVASIGYLQSGSFGAIVNRIQTSLATGQTVLTGDTVWLLVLVITIPFIQSLSGIIDSHLDTKARFKIMRELTIHFDSKIANLDIATFLTPEFRDKMQVAWERGIHVFYAFFIATISSIADIASIVISTLILASINPTLVALALIGAIPGLIVESKYGREVYWIWDLNAETRRRFWSYENNFRDKDLLTELKLLNSAKNFLGKIKKLLTSFDDELEKAEKRKNISEIVSVTIGSAFFGFALYVLVKDGIRGIIPIGTLVFAYTTFRGFQGSLRAFFRNLARQFEFNRYVDALWGVIDLKPSIVSKIDAKRIPSDIPPVVEFKNVTFRYPNTDKDVLKDVSFTIKAGQKIGIVGLNGAGKTTLVNILARVYDPTGGNIYLDGTDLRDINHEDWLKVLAYMPQSFTVCRGLSLLENIALGNPDKEIDKEQVYKATKKSTADSFINELKNKYESVVGAEFKDGVEVSRGQVQKLVIAKVFYRNSPFLILDEPTSSVDAVSQEIIFKNLEEHTEGKTVLMISHNFSTIKNADLIMLIEEGEIIERGTHEELIHQNGHYKSMFDKQVAGYGIEV